MGLRGQVRSEPVPRRLEEAIVGDLIARLRETAGRMVPFSEAKRLLREAASAIERLDGEARDHTTEVARLTAQLNQLGPVRARPDTSTGARWRLGPRGDLGAGN
jgi:hypothetical protein